MTYYLKNTSGSTVSVIDLGIQIPDGQSIVIDSNARNGYLSTDMSSAINNEDLILSTTDIGDPGGDFTIAEAIAALSFLSANDKDNPHDVTITQAIASDSGTTFSLSDLNELSDGSDTSLHNHDNRYFTETELSTSGQSTIHWDNLTNVPALGSPEWREPVLCNLDGRGTTAERTTYAGSANEGEFWLDTDDDHLYKFISSAWVDQGAPSEGDRVIFRDDNGVGDTSDDKIYTYTSSAWDSGITPLDNWMIMVNDDGDGSPAQYVYDSEAGPPDWIKVADINWGDHNSIGGRDDANSHPATAISFSNSTSGLDATTVQAAIDEIATEQGVDIDNLLIVSKNGNDSATGVILGTWANPYATIGAAITAASSATETNRFGIFIMPGTYTENVTLSTAYVYLMGLSKESVVITSASGITLTISTTTEKSNGVMNATLESTSTTSTDEALLITGNNPIIFNVILTATAGARSAFINGAYNQTIKESYFDGGELRIDAGIISFTDSKLIDGLLNITGGTLRIENGYIDNSLGNAINQSGTSVVYLVSGRLNSESASSDYNQAGGTVYWGWVEYDSAKVSFSGTRTLLFMAEDESYDNSTSGLTATNVQTAIDEVDGNVDTVISDLSTHEGLTNNPHTVTFTQAVTADSGTDISAAEAETLTDGSNADLLHEHASSNITYDNGVSGLSATDVKNAIDEVDGDISTVASNLSSHVGSTSNPHAVTITQAISADAGTDITTTQLETLSDGSNADALHDHAASNISFNDTTTSLGATTVQGAIEALDATLDDLLPKGTSFPGSPSDGDLFYRTDLNMTYQYDGSRSKWLSITQMFLDWGAASANGRYLNIHGATATQTGYLMPKNGTIINVTAKIASGNLTKDFEIRRNHNSTTPLKSFSLSSGSYTSITDNIDFAAGDYIQVFCDSTGVAARDVVILATIAWRS